MPGENELGVFEIKKFRKYPNLIITFCYINKQGASQSFFSVKVEYQFKPGYFSDHSITLHSLPTKMVYMAYFIYRHLVVYLTNNDMDIKYAALKQF